MADDFARQLLDALYNPETQPPQQPSRPLREKLVGAAETAATLGSGILGSVPAGLAGLSQLLPTRGRAPSTNRAAQKVEDVQSALTYLPRTEAGQEYLEKTAGALGVLGIPAEFLGEQALKLTGSPFLATAANVGLDPVNYIGIPGTGKALASGAKAMGRAAAAAPRVAGDILSSVGTGPTPGSRAAQLGAIKMKGGNWLAGEVEGATQSLKRETVPQELADEFGLGAGNRTQDALNNWIDKKLNRYIKNEMATPEDPVRKLAEQGILHYQPEAMPRYMDDVWAMREKTGFPKMQATSPLAQKWEAYADQMVRAKQLGEPIRSGNIGGMTMRDLIASEPGGEWALKAPNEQMVYELRRPGTSSTQVVAEELGFPHLIDELKNSIRPDSDLPAHLRWKPEDLEKVTMEQAVRRVHEINEYRAAKKAEANEVLARNPATFTFKEYPTVPGSDKPNEKGLAWKEIRLPEEMPTGYVEDTTVGGKKVWAKEGSSTFTNKDPKTSVLEEALKYEGEVMGHCVGGYCDDVLSGRTKIYSLRDKKGEPHVTIEVGAPDVRVDGNTPLDFWRENKELVGEPLPQDTMQQVAFNRKIIAMPEFQQWLNNKPGEIIQIKGKANRAPKEEYLPFVQDFVRSGNWSRVGDIQNTKLTYLYPDSEVAKALIAKGIEPPKYVTNKEYEDLRKQAFPEPGLIIPEHIKVQGKKSGGKVHISDNPDTMQLELAGGGAVAAAKAAAKAAEKAAAQAASKQAAEQTAKSIYPQAEALERARQNAVKMLGLPENNTAMDRARAMGFDDNWFHGTNRDFPAFENSMLGAKTGAKSAQKAHFLAKNPELSNTYVNTENVFPLGHKAAPPVYESLFKNKDAFAEFNAAPDWDSQWRVLEKYGMNYGSGQVMPLMVRLGNQRVKDYGGAGYRDVTYNDELKAAKKGKKDSVVFKNTFDPGPHEGRNVQTDVAAIFDPSRIRSRFAAFDPAEMDKSDLLKKKGGKVSITDNLDTMRLAVQKRK